jgi:hypothetical protein
MPVITLLAVSIQYIEMMLAMLIQKNQGSFGMSICHRLSVSNVVDLKYELNPKERTLW